MPKYSLSRQNRRIKESPKVNNIETQTATCIQDLELNETFDDSTCKTFAKLNLTIPCGN